MSTPGVCDPERDPEAEVVTWPTEVCRVCRVAGDLCLDYTDQPTKPGHDDEPRGSDARLRAKHAPFGYAELRELRSQGGANTSPASARQQRETSEAGR